MGNGKRKATFWERMQDPEDLWIWQTTGKMRGQIGEDSKDSEETEEQEA